MNNFKSLSCGTKRGGGKTCAGNRTRKKKGVGGEQREQQHRFSGAALAASLTVCSVTSIKIRMNFAGTPAKINNEKRKKTTHMRPEDVRMSARLWNGTNILLDRGLQSKRWPIQTLCSLFPPCHSHPHPLGAAAALHADAATKQTSHCRIKLWQRWNTAASCPVFTHLLRPTNTAGFFFFFFLKPLQFRTTERTVGNTECVPLRLVILCDASNLEAGCSYTFRIIF